ncbi:MAG: LptA/OstA family protein [Myxococcota bacterium]
MRRLFAIGLWLLGTGAALAQAPEPAVPPERSVPAEPPVPTGIRIDRRAPMDIRADQLEAVRDPDGRERVIFEQNVTVRQEDLRIGCDRLEAVYPKESGGGPERLRCSGSVRIVQGDLRAECQEAIFDRLRSQAVCRGHPARVHRGENVVEGPHILFDTARGVMKVKGGVRIEIRPAEEAE